MRVQSGLDLLRIDLLAAHVDHAADPAQKMIAAVPQRHDVPGVDKPVRVREGYGGAKIARGSTGGADAQRAAVNPQFGT